MLEFLALLLGYPTNRDAVYITGRCRGVYTKSVPCVVKEQPFGVKYISDYRNIWRIRPVFWGGHSEILHSDGKGMHDICRMRGKDIYCLNSLVFISDEKSSDCPCSPLPLAASPSWDPGSLRRWSFA